MEINKGMYVKYIRGMINGYVPPRIAKATDCSDKDLIKIDNGQVILRNDILKASYNIIDLIEEGDYVNGYKVYSGGKKHFDYILTWDEQNNYYMKIDLLTVNIKSIVTKEVFKANEYRVEAN